MPGLDRRARELRARHVVRVQSAAGYAGLAADEVRRAELVARALAAVGCSGAGGDDEAWESAVSLVVAGMPVEEAAALLGLDAGRLDRLVRRRRSARPAGRERRRAPTPSGKTANGKGRPPG